jgi:hypothetical protein
MAPDIFVVNDGSGAKEQGEGKKDEQRRSSQGGLLSSYASMI